jgi:hypothetical protein
MGETEKTQKKEKQDAWKQQPEAQVTNKGPQASG